MSSTSIAMIDEPLIAVGHPQPVGREHRQLVIGHVDDFVGVAGQRRGVAGDEVLAAAHPDHQRTAQPGGNHHPRPIAKDDRQTVGPVQLRKACSTAATSGR